ncbi:peptidylprolyl isomerase [uncultured Pseudoteredinibacter sp.]|uniref:peptidylprolyl isomerase n=1 Tax=uncultured Pseudoteredinibacter sp. TaxID=1641701 RepID=UPI0026231655|nr:peptidylprolyl isomerase [uncultured Pseudoteredinibacter sp.]
MKPFNNLKQSFFLIGLCISLLFSAQAWSEKRPQIKLQTTMGDIYLELYPDKSPIAVENFLKYVDRHFYDGLIFHRVMPRFMIQTGGFGFDFSKKETDDPIKNESANGLSNSCGSVAMARLGDDPDSGSSQFYINVNNNKHLDIGDNEGYTVFGRVIKGIRVAEAISELRRGKHSGQFSNAPNQMVQIIKATRTKGQKIYNTKCAAMR